MRKLWLLLALLLLLLTGCAKTEYGPQVAATTLPVYTFAEALCVGTDIQVTRLISESVSCLHDYSLQVGQMKAIEKADLVVISGAGLEDFMEDVLTDKEIIDASSNIPLHCPDEGHEEHEDHHHETDPHIWLSPENAKIMVTNICAGLEAAYPQHKETFRQNLATLDVELTHLQEYGDAELKELACRELLTFHDGFGYLAQAFDLEILHAIEEESGREASAAELIELCVLVEDHDLPALFTEKNGSVSAASIISAETGAKIYALDMAMGGDSYFDSMYHNINTLKEALG